MRKQIFSFKGALRGILKTINSESHMRFHLVAAFYVILFSYFYEFTPVEYSILIILIASVIAAEILNTCIEELCDLVADRYEPLIRFIKDASAGVVLILSVAAFVIALLFFIDFEVINIIVKSITSNVLYIIAFLLSVLISFVFVAIPPSKIITKLTLRLKN